MHKLTKKKVSIIGHSLGNLNILYNLHHLDKEFKKKHVRNYMAIAPPFLGSYKSAKYLLAATKDFTYGGILGFKYEALV